MSAFGGLVLTNRGKILQSKAQSGVALKYTRIALGDGRLGASSILELNTLIHEVKTLPIAKLKILTGGRAVVGSVLTNQELISGFYFRELGVFAIDPDIGEILYCYGNAGDLAEYIPASGSDIIEKNIDVQMIVGNASNVSAAIDTSLVWETVEGSQEKVNVALIAAKDHTDQEIGNHIANGVGHGTSSKAEAQAGTSHASYMTPLRVAEAILALQAVASVNGKKGSVTLNKSDIGLPNVWDMRQINAIASGATNSDPNTTLESYILSNHENTPSGSKFWHILTLFYGSAGTSSGRCQVAISYNNTGFPRMLYREYFSGAWTPWTEDFNKNNYGNVVFISSSVTLGSIHANSVSFATNSIDKVITVPNALDIGTQITIIKDGTGKVTFAPASGVTLNSVDGKRSIIKQHASATLVKATATVWQLFGALE